MSIKYYHVVEVNFFDNRDLAKKCIDHCLRLGGKFEIDKFYKQTNDLKYRFFFEDGKSLDTFTNTALDRVY